MEEKIFKAYDIRGIYPSEIDEEAVERIIKAYVTWLKPKRVSLGRDVRLSSESLFRTAEKAFIDSGVDVVDIGVVTTDMHYFAVANYGLNGGIIITASHNPAEYNGMKMVREKAMEVSLDMGADKIRDIALRRDFSSSQKRGKSEKLDIMDDYLEKILSLIDQKAIKKKKIVVNPNFGAAGKVLLRLSNQIDAGIELIKLNFEENGNFPKGRPDPIIEQNRVEIGKVIRDEKADFGVAWDADADRCFFFDEKGEFVDASHEMAILAQIVLEKYPGGKVVHDPRSIRVIREKVAEAGGTTIMEKAGRSNIKNRMSKEKAVFGGETSGHFFYKDYYYCDNGMITFLLMLEKISKSGIKLSEIAKPYREKYPVSGEKNFEVKDTKKKLEKIKEKYKDGKIELLDGISITYPDWRFNLRSSNTEPLLRLNLEAKSQKLVDEKVAGIQKLIES